MSDLVSASKLKAYKVEPYHGDGYATVVFAKNRGEAKALALQTDCCERCQYTEIRAIRYPAFDDQYRGHWEADWYDPNDRLAMVRDGWHCEYVGDDDCEKCTGRRYCDIYAEWKKDMEFWSGRGPI